MNTDKRQLKVMERPTTQLSSLMGLEAQQLVKYGEDLGWETAALGQAPLPTQPVRAGDWLIVPAEQDSSVVPARALKRVQALYEAGFRPKGFVMVHEAPALLASPQADQPRKWWASLLPGAKDGAQTAAMVGGAVAATAVVGAIALVAVGAVVVLALPLLAVASVATVDPILIAVTEDDFWIEIDRWDI